MVKFVFNHNYVQHNHHHKARTSKLVTIKHNAHCCFLMSKLFFFLKKCNIIKFVLEYFYTHTHISPTFSKKHTHTHVSTHNSIRIDLLRYLSHAPGTCSSSSLSQLSPPNQKEDKELRLGEGGKPESNSRAAKQQPQQWRASPPSSPPRPSPSHPPPPSPPAPAASAPPSPAPRATSLPAAA